MALLNQTDAAKMANVSRPTINRHIKQGKLSTVKNHDGSISIESSEVLRVYGATGKQKKSSDALADVMMFTHGHDKNVNVELLEYKVEQLEKQLAESKAQNDKFLNIIETQSLIEHEKKSSFWERLFKK